MAFKNAGPCDLYTENILLNPGSYSTTNGTDSPDFKLNAIDSGTGPRTGHVPDSTAYATQPTVDNWSEWLHGKHAGGTQV